MFTTIAILAASTLAALGTSAAEVGSTFTVRIEDNLPNDEFVARTGARSTFDFFPGIRPVADHQAPLHGMETR